MNPMQQAMMQLSQSPLGQQFKRRMPGQMDAMQPGGMMPPTGDPQQMPEPTRQPPIQPHSFGYDPPTGFGYHHQPQSPMATMQPEKKKRVQTPAAFLNVTL
jgi:hypothetical protein